MRYKIYILACFVLLALSAHSQWRWINPQPQGNKLKSTWFVNQDVGYAAGSVGTIIKTIDGGQSWSVKNLNEISKYVSFLGICFPEENTGYAVDDYGYIYKTVGGHCNCDKYIELVV
jgi:photosystem II stability/assembly factor-like uncharacterized protein